MYVSSVIQVFLLLQAYLLFNLTNNALADTHIPIANSVSNNELFSSTLGIPKEFSVMFQALIFLFSFIFSDC